MDLYFHHVGQQGAAEDFKKTVYKKRTIYEIEPLLPDSLENKQDFISNLKTLFNDGLFNCWGVPAGAQTVIKNLKAGDAVLLIESASAIGKVPVLGIVKFFTAIQMRELSQYLWGNDKFPYIFFFNTELLNLEWLNFLDHLEYASNFNPRGNFYKVGDTKLSHFRPVENYISFLRKNYGKDDLLNITEADFKQIIVEDIAAKNNIYSEFKEIVGKLNDNPMLKDDIQSKEIKLNRTPRDNAFSLAVKKVYKYKCAISGLSLFSPDGKTELQSAHIYPKSLKGSDDIRNGILLTRLLHWAFDCGWISISDDHIVLVKKNIPKSPDYAFITQWEGKRIALPEDESFHPHPLFLYNHREIHGF